MRQDSANAGDIVDVPRVPLRQCGWGVRVLGGIVYCIPIVEINSKRRAKNVAKKCGGVVVPIYVRGA